MKPEIVGRMSKIFTLLETLETAFEESFPFYFDFKESPGGHSHALLDPTLLHCSALTFEHRIEMGDSVSTFWDQQEASRLENSSMYGLNDCATVFMVAVDAMLLRNPLPGTEDRGSKSTRDLLRLRLHSIIHG